MNINTQESFRNLVAANPDLPIVFINPHGIQGILEIGAAQIEYHTVINGIPVSGTTKEELFDSVFELLSEQVASGVDITKCSKVRDIVDHSEVKITVYFK